MKLINYKRGYNNRFDCSIHGTIYMSYNEWEKAYKYLNRTTKELYSKQILHEDVKRQISTIDGFIINIRVTATQLLAKHYKLTNYKKNNYQIQIGNRNFEKGVNN